MKKGIKYRWKHYILYVTIAMLFVLSCISIYAIFSRYMSMTEVTIRERSSKTVDTYFSYYNGSDDEYFAIGATDFAQSFTYKNMMEVWVLDKDGNVVASSSGFNTISAGKMVDYEQALLSEDNTAVERTALDNGEPIMAMSYILRNSLGDEYGAVRYMISLSEIYVQIALVSSIIILGLLLIVILISMSGIFFVSSIVKPVEKITVTTKEIAKGNFKVKINNEYYDDEIGELCDNINEMAEQLGETDRMKNEFISTVSHEIRTPLTAIRGWGETLQRTIGETDELSKKGLDIIIEETGRLSTMVEELLDFSRIQNGKFKLNKQLVDIVADIQQVYLIYKPKAESEGVELTLNFDEESDYYVEADKDKICQVFINLLDNAIKYTKSQGKVEISVERNEKCVKIVFSDNGCGISENDLNHVKEKFFKVNSNVRGTGIGLSVADEIVSLHGGELNIKSQLGKGTTVEVTLPTMKKEK